MGELHDAAEPTGEFESLPISASMIADLRSDHAGEVGAVMIYKGILAVSRDPGVRAFALRHLAGERRHLAFFDEFLPARHKSRILPLWRLAGWITGAVPALFGPSAVYSTIEAVETFVDRHYADQIDQLSADPRVDALRSTLDRFRQDEIAHRDEAATHPSHDGAFIHSWQRLVEMGSAAGVAVARRV